MWAQHQKAGIHLTYRCNLACLACNRMSYLRPTCCPDMTVADMEDFLAQAEDIGWREGDTQLRFVGGEPTQHDDLIECLSLAKDFLGGDTTRIHVWSHGYGERAKSVLQQVKTQELGTIVTATQKGASKQHPHRDLHIAPADCGEERLQPCHFHSRMGIQGICVDSQGYIGCVLGGMIDSILHLNLRTKTLANLRDQEFIEQQSLSLCQWCGRLWGKGLKQTNPQLETILGVEMSETWANAVKNHLQ